MFVFFCHDAAPTPRQCPSLSLLVSTTVAGDAGRWFAVRGTSEVRPLEQSSRVGVVATFVLAVAVAVAVTVTVVMAVAAAIAVAVIRSVAVAVVLDVAEATVLAMATKVSLFDY